MHIFFARATILLAIGAVACGHAPHQELQAVRTTGLRRDPLALRAALTAVDEDVDVTVAVGAADL